MSLPTSSVVANTASAVSNNTTAFALSNATRFALEVSGRSQSGFPISIPPNESTRSIDNVNPTAIDPTRTGDSITIERSKNHEETVPESQAMDESNEPGLSCHRGGGKSLNPIPCTDAGDKRTGNDNRSFSHGVKDAAMLAALLATGVVIENTRSCLRGRKKRAVRKRMEEEEFKRD